ncbi:MAG TPA: ABC transporter permease subunit [Thermoanaerobaculia bacterium]|nr:ABC transporter permease subunit [Thermoanaerobaculia bacterium]
MSGREIRHLYLAELRGAFRERNVLINTVLLPVLLYPLMLWALINGIMLVRGQTERLHSRVAVPELPQQHAGLLERIEENERMDVELLPAAGEPASGTGLGAGGSVRLGGDGAGAAGVEARIAAGDLDAALGFEARSERSGDFRAVVTHDSAREASAAAGARLLDILREYRGDWLRGRASALVTEAEWDGFRVERANLATSAQMGAMILGLIAPLYFVVMVAVGCLYPAVDTTAGEHERGTWETTLTLAVSRLSIVTAKYLYVTTMGFVAGVLNLTAMTLSMGSVLAPLMTRGEQRVGFQVPWATLPWLLLGALLLAASVAAAMMMVAVFARTFREGQALVTPVYLLSFLPVLFLGREGLELTPALAAIPVVNVALLVREALGGSLPVGPTALTIAVELALIAVLLLLASRVIRNEDVLTGSHSGGPMAFLRQRLRGRARASAAVSP